MSRRCSCSRKNAANTGCQSRRRSLRRPEYHQIPGESGSPPTPEIDPLYQRFAARTVSNMGIPPCPNPGNTGLPSPRRIFANRRRRRFPTAVSNCLECPDNMPAGFPNPPDLRHAGLSQIDPIVFARHFHNRHFLIQLCTFAQGSIFSPPILKNPYPQGRNIPRFFMFILAQAVPVVNECRLSKKHPRSALDTARSLRYNVPAIHLLSTAG